MGGFLESGYKVRKGGFPGKLIDEDVLVFFFSIQFHRSILIFFN